MPPHRRFHAPAGDGEVLAAPGFDAIPALVEANRRLLDRSDVVIGGLQLRELRALARREVLDLANGPASIGERPCVSGPRLEPLGPLTRGRSPDAPLLLAGHQPDLSHPGVWVKNFALNGLARKLGGTPLHLVVDNDTLKSTSLRFPVFRDHDPESVHTEAVAFDELGPEKAYEGRSIFDPALFLTFADRVSPRLRHWGYEPLLRRAWELARAGLAPLVPKSTGGALSPVAKKIGETFTRVRRRFELEWGCDNLDVPVSRLAHTTAYARFVWAIFNDLPRFRDVHNAAIQQYRRLHQLQSASHPVPELGAEGAWIETPFWTYCGTGPSWPREKLVLRANETSFEYRIANCSFPGPSDDGRYLLPRDVEEFCRHVPRYKLIRPRALTLTLFARVCLGDFFIHGIGGGKYDEVTDAIIRDYFGIEPPAYQVLSATLHLPLPGYPSTSADVERAERLVRDLTWSPQRHLPADHSLVREKQALAAKEPPPGDRADRRKWFRELHEITERLRPLVADRLADAEAALRWARAEVHANGILKRRDYAWVLYPEETLRPFLQRFLEV